MATPPTSRSSSPDRSTFPDFVELPNGTILGGRNYSVQSPSPVDEVTTEVIRSGRGMGRRSDHYESQPSAVQIDGTPPSPSSSPSRDPAPVSSATVDRTTRRNPVGATEVDLTHPASNSAPINFRFTRVDPNDNKMELNLRRVDTAVKRAIVFNSLGSTANVLSIERSKQSGIDEAYAKLRELVVPDARTCKFNLSKMTVQYEDSNGIQHLDDLQDLVESNPEIREAYEDLDALVRGVWGGPTKSQFFEKGSKSSNNSEKAMVRNNEALKALPKDQYAATAKLALQLYASSGADDAKQKEALKRITGVEKLIYPLIALLTTEIRQAETSLGTASANDRPGIEAKLREMRDLKAKLDADRLGLYVAAAFAAFAPLPRNNPNYTQALADANQAVNNAHRILQDHFESVRDGLVHKNVRTRFREWRLLPEFIRGKEDPIRDNQEYSIDAAGLIYSSLPIALARTGYLDYMRTRQSFQKIEGIEDAILRITLAGDQNSRYIDSLIGRLSDNIKLHNDNTTTLKQKLKTEFTTSKTAAQNILNGTTNLNIPNAAPDLGQEVNRLAGEHFRQP